MPIQYDLAWMWQVNGIQCWFKEVAEWPTLFAVSRCAAVWGEEGEEEEQLEEDPEPVDAEDEDVEPPAKRRVVAKSP